jgi:hypothetical protein
MSLKQFFRAIDNSFIGRIVDSKMNIIEHTDSQRIYVENVRAFYNMPTFAAKFFCELAVRENIFVKKLALNCPDCGRVITSVSNKKDIPSTIICEHCELLEKDKFEFKLTDRDVLEFYQLNEDSNG